MIHLFFIDRKASYEMLEKCFETYEIANLIDVRASSYSRLHWQPKDVQRFCENNNVIYFRFFQKIAPIKEMSEILDEIHRALTRDQYNIILVCQKKDERMIQYIIEISKYLLCG